MSEAHHDVRNEQRAIAEELPNGSKDQAGSGDVSPMASLVGFTRVAVSEFLTAYHRHSIDVDAAIPDSPVLFVANHGFGGVVDLNVAATQAALDAAGVTRPTTTLVHQIAWTLGVGKLVEAFGGRSASAEAVADAFGAEHNVLVFPGGDVDAAKSWDDRNKIVFAGRTGFARAAIQYQVPIVPIVTCGAGESLYVLDDGRDLAKALRLERFRVKALPISLSIPWGLSIGIAGMLPYIPLPTKLSTSVLTPIYPGPEETAEELAARVEAAMQDRLTQLAAEREGQRQVNGGARVAGS